MEKNKNNSQHLGNINLYRQRRKKILARARLRSDEALPITPFGPVSSCLAPLVELSLSVHHG